MGRGKRQPQRGVESRKTFYLHADTPSAQTADELAGDVVIVLEGFDRQFVARVVRAGERFGRQRALVHDKEMPLVVFYDAKHKNDSDLDERSYGQMTGGSYSLDTLLGHDANAGLALDLGIPEWTVPAAAMAELLPFLRRHLPQHPRERLSPLAERQA